MDEYAQIEGLLGNPDITDEKVEELLGRIRRLPFGARRTSLFSRLSDRMKTARQTQARQGSIRTAAPAMMPKNATSKSEMLARLNSLPPEIKLGLHSKQLQLTDAVLYSAKDVNGKSDSIELMTNEQVAEVGRTNLNHRKLEQNKYFMVTAIQILEGNATDTKTATFSAPSSKITNGEFELEVGGTVLLEKTSSQIFATGSRTDIPAGYYRLDNPKMIVPQTEIKPTIWLTATDVPSVKVLLHGSMVAKR